MLREGKHGLVEEGQGETKAQVKDVPDNYSSKKKNKKKNPTESTQNISCCTLCYYNM